MMIFYSFFLILLTNLLESGTSKIIYDQPSVFYTQLCSFQLQGINTQTFLCNTAQPQVGVIRKGLAVAQYSKPQQLLQFTTSLSSTAFESSYQITITVNSPTSQVAKLGFFLILIKSQTTQFYIDLINFKFLPGSGVDDFNTIPRTQTLLKSITDGSTIFSSITSNMKVIPFVSDFQIFAPLNMSGGVDLTKQMEYSLTCSISGTDTIINLIAEPETKITTLSGLVLIVNQQEIVLSRNNGLYMNYQTTQFSMSLGVFINMTILHQNYGPSFNSKCLLGFFSMKYKGDDSFLYNFQFDTSGFNFQGLKQNLYTLAQNKGNTFCFGNNTICQGTDCYIDLINNFYYTASTCPLPVFVGWTLNNTCPSCTQLICDNCALLNRSQCTSCKIDSHSSLNGTSCICDTNYYEYNINISSSSQGLWNNQTSSLSQCRLNCSLAILNCLQNSCTNQTFCYNCAVGSFLNYINETFQNCSLCSDSTFLTSHCFACDNSTFCTFCESGFYLKSIYNGTQIIGVICQSCANALLGCQVCSDNLNCQNCSTGYILNASNQCQCDASYNNLVGCLACDIPTECIMCNVGYFLDNGTNLCTLCTIIHPNCTECLDSFTCQKCQDQSYVLDPILVVGTVTCSLCVDLIPLCSAYNCTNSTFCAQCIIGYYPDLVNSTYQQCVSCNSSLTLTINCLECDNENFCTLCQVGYYLKDILNGSTIIGKTCQLCNNTLIGCLQCSNNSTCNNCSGGYILNSSQKCFCDITYNSLVGCLECSIPSECINCSISYYLNTSSRYCDICSNIHPNCSQCVDEYTCQKCQDGSYVLDPFLITGVISCSLCIDLIPFCSPYNCTNITFCTQCIVGFFTDLVNSTYQQCIPCNTSSTLTINCLDCYNQNFCTLCQIGYYLKEILNGSTIIGVTCQICSIPLIGCLQCSDNFTCNNCSIGYSLNSSQKCSCDVTYNSLVGCLECNIPTECINCTIGYYLNSSTKYCEPCTNIHLNCTQCSDQLTCTSCIDVSFVLDSYTFIGVINCSLCTDLINFCQIYSCNNSTFCNQCIVGYYTDLINSTHQYCSSCNSSLNLTVECLECSNSFTCTLCSTTYYLKNVYIGTNISSITCQICKIPLVGCNICANNITCTNCSIGFLLNSLSKCDCDINYANILGCLKCGPPTDCINCAIGYYLNNGTKFCDPCSNIHLNCTECQNDITCTKCMDSSSILDPYAIYGLVICSQCIDLISFCSPYNCSNTTFCKECIAGYYTNLINSSQNCLPCNGTLQYCTTCQNQTTCLTCQIAYILNTTSFQCFCNVNFNNLVNCLFCLIPTQCHICVYGYYVENITKLCNPCTDVHPQCLGCSDNYTCIQCATYYGPDPRSVPGQTICTLCSAMIDNCLLCDNWFYCSTCQTNYGLTMRSNQCLSCSFLMEGCILCSVQNNCLSCNNQTLKVNNTCHYCNKTRSHCLECLATSNNQISCIKCQPGYLLYLDITLGINICRTCENIFNYCTSCSLNTCIACMFPYLLGNSTGTCDQCASGYQYISGHCLKYPGCQSTINITYNSTNITQICLSCIVDLHFVYNSTDKTCVCDKGYTSVYPTNGSLMRCQSVCGDAMFFYQYEQCDDGNLLNKDGCNQQCIIQRDFICKGNSTSKCYLVVNFTSIKFNYVKRIIRQNKCMISYTLYPPHQGLDLTNWTKHINFNLSQKSANKNQFRYTYSNITGQLQVQVPYYQQLQNSIIQLNITFDPQYVKSLPTTLFITHQLNGINAPLIFDSDILLANIKVINIISIILIVIIILQFYIGSYFHKMIGLETITVIQIIYFVRMLGNQTSINILNSINTIKYSTTGYQNSQILFGNQKQTKIDSWKSIPNQFNIIQLNKYFLLNVNFFIFPVFVIMIIYLIFLAVKIYLRSEYLQTNQLYRKDKFVTYKRKSLWIYNHLVFPYTMMFTPIVLFSAIIYMSSSVTNIYLNNDYIQIISFIVHLILFFITTAIYCYQVLNSYQEYQKYRIASEQRSQQKASKIQRLQHDQNNPDRPNYHPFYVLIFLISQNFIWFNMVLPIYFPKYYFSLQIIMFIAIIYFLTILKLRPYHSTIKIHNKYLLINHGMVVIFVAICVIFQNLKKTNQFFYIVCMYLITGLLGIIMIGGYIRIYHQKRFQYLLQYKKLNLYIRSQNILQINQLEAQLNHANPISKKQKLIQHNQFAFRNQLKKLDKNTKYNPKNKVLNDTIEQVQDDRELSPQRQQFLIGKIRQEYRIINNQNSFINNLFQRKFMNTKEKDKNNVLNTSYQVMRDQKKISSKTTTKNKKKMQKKQQQPKQNVQQPKQPKQEQLQIQNIEQIQRMNQKKAQKARLAMIKAKMRNQFKLIQKDSEYTHYKK